MLKKWILCLVAFCAINLSYANTKAPGNLFNIKSTPSNNIVSVATLCLNARSKPVSCQFYAFTGYTITLNTTIPNHTYPYAGIKLDNSPYVIGVSNQGPQCQLQNNGYCIFPVSNQTPVTIQLVNPNQQLNLFPPQLPPAVKTKRYEQNLFVSGGYPPYTWSANLGTLSSALSFSTLSNTSISRLVGTGPGNSIPNTVALGVYPITITVTDSQKNPATLTKNYDLFVNGSLTINPQSGFLGNYVNGQTITPINLTVTNALPNSAITYSKFDEVNHPWPPNWQITQTSTNTAQISGQSTVNGVYDFFVLAQDGIGNQGIVNYQATVINTILSLNPSSGTTLPDGTLSSIYAYNFNINNYSSVSPPLTYTNDNTPAGFTFLPNPTSDSPYTTSFTTGPSAFPTTIGYYNMLITATDASLNSGSGVYKLSITGQISILPSDSIPNGEIGSVYQQVFTADNVSTTDTLMWSISNSPANLELYTPSSTSVPAECTQFSTLALNQALLCGTPTEVYNQSNNPLTINVADVTTESIIGNGTISYPEFIIQGNATFSPSSTATFNLTQGIAMTPQTFTVSNCGAGCTFSISSLPSGIQATTTTNSFTFSGTPTSAGSGIIVSVSATSPTLENTGTGQYTFNISGPIFTFTPNSASYTVGYNRALQQTIAVSSTLGFPLASVSAQGSIPPKSTYKISGNSVIMSFSNTPSYCPTGGCPTRTYSIQLVVTDTNGNTGTSGTYQITYNGNTI